MEPARAETADDIRVLVVDDEPLFVEMVHALLTAEAGISVVATARNGRLAVRLAEDLDPDVIVMDGIEATRVIRGRDPDACVLILTGGTTPDDIDRARKAGAASYLTKDRIGTELIEQIRSLGSK